MLNLPKSHANRGSLCLLSSGVLRGSSACDTDLSRNNTMSSGAKKAEVTQSTRASVLAQLTKEAEDALATNAAVNAAHDSRPADDGAGVLGSAPLDPATPHMTRSMVNSSPCVTAPAAVSSETVNRGVSGASGAPNQSKSYVEVAKPKVITPKKAGKDGANSQPVLMLTAAQAREAKKSTELVQLKEHSLTCDAEDVLPMLAQVSIRSVADLFQYDVGGLRAYLVRRGCEPADHHLMRLLANRPTKPKAPRSATMQDEQQKITHHQASSEVEELINAAIGAGSNGSSAKPIAAESATEVELPLVAAWLSGQPLNSHPILVLQACNTLAVQLVDDFDESTNTDMQAERLEDELASRGASVEQLLPLYDQDTLRTARMRILACSKHSPVGSASRPDSRASSGSGSCVGNSGGGGGHGGGGGGNGVQDLLYAPNQTSDSRTLEEEVGASRVNAVLDNPRAARGICELHALLKARDGGMSVATAAVALQRQFPEAAALLHHENLTVPEAGGITPSLDGMDACAGG